MVGDSHFGSGFCVTDRGALGLAEAHDRPVRCWSFGANVADERWRAMQDPEDESDWRRQHERLATRLNVILRN